MLLGSAEATERIGAALASQLRAGDVIALFGDLGRARPLLRAGFCAASVSRRCRKPDFPDRPAL
jgi:tRNA threonylcarbamoyladenosine biosynthesis protein TsaE